MPPSTLGVFFVCQVGLPGSTRSGENARNTSSPITRPSFSRRGCITSRVVPGYVVLSSTISMPGCARRATASAAAITYDMSGSRVFASGVGTAMETVSARAIAASSAVATNFPLFTCAATWLDGTSWMCETPVMSWSTSDCVMS